MNYQPKPRKKVKVYPSEAPDIKHTIELIHQGQTPTRPQIRRLLKVLRKTHPELTAQTMISRIREEHLAASKRIIGQGEVSIDGVPAGVTKGPTVMVMDKTSP